MKLQPNHSGLCSVFVDALPMECTCGLDNLRYGYKGLREALVIAKAGLEAEGCQCSDDGQCSLCAAGDALENYPQA